MSSPPSVKPVVKKMQAASALAFASFLVPHLVNTTLGWFGEDAYNGYQATVRLFYHSTLGEALVLGSLGVHLATSAYIVYCRKQAAATQPSSPPVATASVTWNTRLHRYGGYVLAFFIVGHVFGCRFHGPAPEFSGLSYLLRHPWLRYLFLPYLVVFAAAGVVHLAIGLPIALRLVGANAAARRIRPWCVHRAVLVGGVAATTVGVLAIAGWFFALPVYSGTPFIVAFGY